MQEHLNKEGHAEECNLFSPSSFWHWFTPSWASALLPKHCTAFPLPAELPAQLLSLRCSAALSLPCCPPIDQQSFFIRGARTWWEFWFCLIFFLLGMLMKCQRFCFSFSRQFSFCPFGNSCVEIKAESELVFSSIGFSTWKIKYKTFFGRA